MAGRDDVARGTRSSPSDVDVQDEGAAAPLASADSSSSPPECAICLQQCVHPIQLPCSHIFCFLCAKGAAIQHPRCAMCRRDFPRGLLDKPKLLRHQGTCTSLDEHNEFMWFYEGRSGGWWQYEERSSKELERRFVNGERSCEVLLAGRLYVVDFGTMTQSRKGEPLLQRRIKRDLACIPCKGIAGIRRSQQTRKEGGCPSEVTEAMQNLNFGSGRSNSSSAGQ